MIYILCKNTSLHVGNDSPALKAICISVICVNVKTLCINWWFIFKIHFGVKDDSSACKSTSNVSGDSSLCTDPNFKN